MPYTSNIVSLGSMFFEALTIFYRGTKPMLRLPELQGQRIAIGPEGSGTRALALAQLKANEIEPHGATQPHWSCSASSSSHSGQGPDIAG